MNVQNLGRWTGWPWVVLCLGAGALVGISPAPVGAFPLAWVGVAPLWWGVMGVKRGRWGLALAWGCGFHGLALAWITGIHPMTWMGVPWGASLAIALLCWLLITLWGAAIVVVWGEGMGRLAPKTGWQNLLFGAALWCSLEAIWQGGPLWWSSLAYTQSPGNLALLHWGRISGPTTVTFLLMVVNGAIAQALLTPKRRFWTGGAIALLIFTHTLGAVWSQQPLSPGEPLKVGIIQGNIPNEIKLYPTGWSRAIAGYTTGYETLAQQGVEVILTPETALPFPWQELVQNHHPFYQAVQRQGVPVWLGAFGQSGTSYTNSLFTITGAGELYSRYDKVKLVPLGEYIPFQSLLGGVINRLSPLDAHLAAGSPTQIFDSPFGRAIVGICYESAFPRHLQRQAAAGGELILTASNNAHYSPAMPAQHHALDVMRAIELDRWAVRATNTGYSAIVTPHGETLWISGINTYELHSATIERRKTQTFYSQWGDWLSWVLGLMAVSLPFWVRFRRRED